MRRTAAIAALLSVCCGCATTVVRETPANVPVTEALLAGVKGVTVQHVSGAWRDEAFAAQCVLKGDGNRLTAVLLSPQMRLATLVVEKPHVIRWERSPRLPSTLDPEYVVFDLAQTLLPTDRLSSALGGEYRVEETPDGKRRNVVKTSDGSLFSVRQVLPDGDVYFRNAVYGYEFTVKTVSHED